MAPVVPNCEPARIVAGDTVKWTRSVADYPPAEGWTLKYSIRGASSLDVGATVVGGVYAVTIAKDDSVTLLPGTYTLAGYVEGTGAQAGEQYEVHRSTIVVAPSVENAVAGQLVSDAEVMLERINAEIKARIDGHGSAHESYAIGGRSLSKIPIAELERLAGVYRHRVWRARNPGASNPSHKVRFGAVA